MAEDTLMQLHADNLFLAVDGYDPEMGFMTSNILESRMNLAMVKSSRKVVAVCDSTNFDRPGMTVSTPLSAVHTVITDGHISDTNANALRSAGIDLIIV
jgi:DeoR family transcriptional regulator of aga operon